MSEELRQSSVKTCPLCDRASDTVDTRGFIDPYSGYTEEWWSCKECFENETDNIRAQHSEDFEIRESWKY